MSTGLVGAATPAFERGCWNEHCFFSLISVEGYNIQRGFEGNKGFFSMQGTFTSSYKENQVFSIICETNAIPFSIFVYLMMVPLATCLDYKLWMSDLQISECL